MLIDLNQLSSGSQHLSIIEQCLKVSVKRGFTVKTITVKGLFRYLL